ncbi:MAG: hypothetical protein IPH13_01715 [Planctomycetes bacterium]|nr:hypothetical protein [Planctomycetota bacterium]MCC7169330.1 hypothetical protein [Planctomycetota bacterium]
MILKATILLLVSTLATSDLAMAKGSTTTFGPGGTKAVAMPGVITVHDAGGMQIATLPAPRRVDALVFGHGRLYVLEAGSGIIICYHRPGGCWDVEARRVAPIAGARRLVATPDGRLVVRSRTEIVELDRDGCVLRRDRIPLAKREHRRPTSELGSAPMVRAKKKL